MPSWTVAQPAAGIGALQVRWRTYGNEYQPSNLKRKRRHGTGRRVLTRRKLKGRKFLSH
ncbi:hypothetical protein DL89DRAFT_264044 [Linderina pennispora]|uniref:Ribosomal protein L34 n=1 Tax=Linderina pennispora TaxID=61395 RepID=A0A1Y1WKP5_9FUNG|nr:uncharacterized protein DL89DRAFT_264044 [Linderina pennispora]ORX74062.1 hypothetical protein DL89DRAFT_264044 [Linderina pennispora]